MKRYWDPTIPRLPLSCHILAAYSTKYSHLDVMTGYKSKSKRPSENI